jgi:hypothetical protein
VYLWGPKAVRVFSTLARGYALGSTLHADSAEEAIAQLTGELGVPAADLARVHLLMVMRIYATSRGGHARRVVSVHRLGERDGAVTLTPLVSHDAEADTFTHDDDAEAALLSQLRGETADDASAELERRIAQLQQLLKSRTFDIPEVRAALSAARGDKNPILLRGDPVND